jgi:formate/nitrite transporter FocA (FNT family)
MSGVAPGCTAGVVGVGVGVGVGVALVTEGVGVGDGVAGTDGVAADVWGDDVPGSGTLGDGSGVGVHPARTRAASTAATGATRGRPAPELPGILRIGPPRPSLPALYPARLTGWHDSPMATDADRLFPGTTFINSALDALAAKDDMSRRVTVPYLQRAAMAGIVIGVFYGAFYATMAVFTGIEVGDTDLAGIGRIIGALVFGWALVFIYFTKSELLTSNMMMVTIGVYHGRLGPLRALAILGLCYLGNALGGLLLAVLIRFSTLASGPVLEAMQHSVDAKLAYVSAGPAGLLDLFIRAILCNFMINLAMLLVYNGYVKGDFAKMIAMVMSVFLFAFLGLEHSVANTVLFTMIGLRSGIDIGLAAGNVGIALLGNYVGGGLLIGLYYAYLNDPRRHLRDAA